MSPSPSSSSLLATMPGFPTRTRLSTAGKITSTTTNAYSQREKSSDPANSSTSLTDRFARMRGCSDGTISATPVTSRLIWSIENDHETSEGTREDWQPSREDLVVEEAVHRAADHTIDCSPELWRFLPCSNRRSTAYEVVGGQQSLQ